MEDWGVKKCISSMHYPKSNGQAKLGIKTAKRTVIDCIDGYGPQRHDQATQAMMTHRNTPHQDLGLLPAEMLYSQAIKDHTPILHKKRQIHKRRETKELSEKAILKIHLLNQKQYNMHSCPL